MFFVSAGRFQNFLLVSWILALGFGGFLLMRKQTGRLLGFTTLGIVAAASMMTASRGVIVWALASAWSLLLLSSGRILGRGAANPRNASSPAGSGFRCHSLTILVAIPTRSW